MMKKFSLAPKKNPDMPSRIIIHTLSLIGGCPVPASAFLSKEA